jgi:hypothetical protein
LPKAELDKKIALWISNEKEKQQQELMVDNDPSAYYRATQPHEAKQRWLKLLFL